MLSISLLRALGKATILENNIVQTTGSAGESVAAGVIFTLPALVFLGFPLQYSRIFLMAMIGGALGVLFMIPLRRQLIVKEHGNLLYPEGTACADVLVAGEKGGSFAGRVFWGLGLGGVYTLFQNSNAVAAIKEVPTYNPAWLPGASMRAAITSEYLGVGYIIGPRVAGTIFAGGVFSWLVLMPAIKFFGSLVPTPIYPSPIPIAQMTSDNLWNYYIRYIGAGAVAAAGLITLVKTLPTIVAALRAGAAEIGKKGGGDAITARGRTARDLPLNVVLAGSAAIVLVLWSLLTFYPVPGARLGVLHNAAAAVLVVIFGFLFVTVSSRICGLIGTSANPISGMTIATLMATCALFLAAGWTAPAYEALALGIGGIVCIAAANAGATSQDLKTGYLVGATPYYQQLGLFGGVFASSFIIGLTLIMVNKGLEKIEPVKLELNANALPEGVVVEGTKEHAGKTYTLLNSIGSRTVPEGKYLADPGHRPDGAAVDAGHRQPGRARSAGAADVRRDQGHPHPEAAVGARAARRLPRDRGRAARHPLLELRGRVVPLDRDHRRHFLRRPREEPRRARDEADGGRRGEPRRPLRQRPHRRRGDRGTARHRREAAGDAGGAAEGRDQVRSHAGGCGQRLRRRHRLRGAGLFALPLRSQAARLKARTPEGLSALRGR